MRLKFFEYFKQIQMNKIFEFYIFTSLENYAK